MAKPLIVVVENDLEHLIPLQLKLAEMLMDVAELEVISDRDYMEEYFIAPRTIDILVIEENMYSDKLSCHMIGKTYVLTDNMGDHDEPVYRMEGASADVVCLFKYCNLNTLIRYIIPLTWSGANMNENEPQLIAVISPAGGTGTTTVSVGISACMKQNLKKVLYLNAGNYQNFSFYLDNKSTLSMEGCNHLKNVDSRIYERMKQYLVKEEFTYLPALKNAREMLGISCQNYVALAKAAQKSGDYDFVIVEIGNELTTEALKFLGSVNKILVIVNQDNYSLSKLNVMKYSINCADKEKYYFICNRFEKEKENAFVSGNEKNTSVISEYIEKVSEDMPLCSCKDLKKVEGIQKTTITLI